MQQTNVKSYKDCPLRTAKEMQLRDAETKAAPSAYHQTLSDDQRSFSFLCVIKKVINSTFCVPYVFFWHLNMGFLFTIAKGSRKNQQHALNLVPFMEIYVFIVPRKHVFPSFKLPEVVDHHGKERIGIELPAGLVLENIVPAFGRPRSLEVHI